jgi:hypothetical protein
MDEEKILKSLMPAISIINGGCPDCVGRFVDTANKCFEETGSEWRYHYDAEADEVSLCRLVDLSKEGD